MGDGDRWLWFLAATACGSDADRLLLRSMPPLLLVIDEDVPDSESSGLDTEDPAFDFLA